MTNKITSKKSKLATAAITAALTASVALPAISNAATAMEKCFGVSPIGKNGCGGKCTGHSCHGTSAVDYDIYDWKYVPKGTCMKMKVVFKQKGSNNVAWTRNGCLTRGCSGINSKYIVAATKKSQCPKPAYPKNWVMSSSS